MRWFLKNTLKQVQERLWQINGYFIKNNFINLFSPGPRSCDTSERSGWVLCFMVKERCKIEEPELLEVEKDHFVACYYWEENK